MNAFSSNKRRSDPSRRGSRMTLPAVLLSMVLVSSLACASTVPVRAQAADTGAAAGSSGAETQETVNTLDNALESIAVYAEGADNIADLTEAAAGIDTSTAAGAGSTSGGASVNAGSSSSNDANFPGSAVSTVSARDEDLLMNVLKSRIGSVEVDDFCASDYNKDGKPEAFAAVGDEDEWGAFKGNLYYVTESNVETVLSDETFWLYQNDSRMLCFDTCDFYLIGKYFTTGDATYIFGVNSSGWYEHPFSQQGMQLTQVGRSPLLTVTLSDYDAALDKSMGFTNGHTWKPYYLYWDGDFKEYGGLQISKVELLTCKGAYKYVEEIENKGYTIDSIYYRGNSMININYSHEDDTMVWYDNMTLLLKGNDAEPVIVNEQAGDLLSKCTYGGIYLPALYEDRATYPAAFAPSQN